MSGICGLVELGGRPVRGAALDAMQDAAAFRGPDGRGRWEGGLDGSERAGRSVALGHLALHVTPESVRERQPLADPDAGLVLVADARLDNRDELIRSLGSRPGDAPFDGGTADTAGPAAPGTEAIGPAPSDAALILAAYRRWGDECAGRLLGDFAFALWDGRRRRLFAARDAMGMRTLYYRIDGERLLFATEIQQMLAVPGVPAEIFEPAVAAHLVGAAGSPEWTFHRGVVQLPPGHALAVGADGPRTWRFWDVDPERRIRHRDEGTYAEEFRALFADAVRARLRSVKPVGLLLSGGTDSGSIAAMAGWLLAHESGVAADIRAYSFAFNQLTESDERHISGPLAEHFGIPVTDVPADDAWPLRDFPHVGPDRDDPFAAVYQLVKQRVNERAVDDGMGTIMTGDRGDEVTGDWVRDLPGLVRAGRWAEVLEERRAHARETGDSWAGFVRTELIRPARRALGGREPRHLRIPPWVPPGFAEAIDLDGIIDRDRVRTPFAAGPAAARYRRIFRAGGTRYTAWQGRAAARHGLAWSDPWSDRRLAEYVLAVPQHVVNRLAEPKRLARRALASLGAPGGPERTRKIIPEQLFDRGFRDRGIAVVRRLFTDSRSERRGYVDAAAFLFAYDRFVRREPVESDPWWPIALEGWLRVHWE